MTRLRTSIDIALAGVASWVRLLASLTPANAAEERERLVTAIERGERVLPAWTYPDPNPDLTEVGAWLREVEREVLRHLPGPLGGVYLERIEELDLEARIARAAGSFEVSTLAQRRFEDGGVQEERRAKRWVQFNEHDRSLPTVGRAAQVESEPSAPAVLSSDEGDPRSLVSKMRARARELELDFEVVVHPALASLAATGDHTIYVARGRPVSHAVVERTVLHETLAHAVPRMNARACALGIFRIGTARGQDDQEGLALWIERRAGLFTPSRRKELAARHLAVRAMRAGADFAEVTGSLYERGIGAVRSVSIAERAFRGSDGRFPGLGREAVYLSAYERVRRALEREPWMLDVLFSGQVSIASAPILRHELGEEDDGRPRPSIRA